MEAYQRHIEKQLEGQKDSPILYDFKKQIFSDMTNRANELTHTGLSDDSVLSDLVISEHQDIKSEYKKYYKKRTEAKRRKKAFINNILGSILFTLASVIIYLTVSFMTGDWAHSWLIIDTAMSLWVVFELSILIVKATKSPKKIFNPGARILLAGNVMIITHLVFLICLLIFNLPHSWLAFIVGVIMIYVCDGIYVTLTKQRIAILNYLFYILASSPMIYIIICALGLEAWSKGWLVIPMAILVDMIIVAIKLIIRHKNAIYEEVE